ncbi:MAG: 50S ribosomal protein L32 [Armatimonadota bacterium]|nr:MAG: 50S ribosomal protein L32 [Armatimonadota bacterium]
MALPKRKISKSRRDNRRANWKLTPPNFSRCPQCHEYRMPHQACPSCGYYSGRAAVQVKERKSQK